MASVVDPVRVRNSILLNLQANKIVYCCFIDDRRRRRISGSETKDVITRGAASKHHDLHEFLLLLILMELKPYELIWILCASGLVSQLRNTDGGKTATSEQAVIKASLFLKETLPDCSLFLLQTPPRERIQEKCGQGLYSWADSAI